MERREQEKHQGETENDMEQMNKIRNMAREEEEKKGRNGNTSMHSHPDIFFNLIHTNPSLSKNSFLLIRGNITIMIKNLLPSKASKAVGC